MAAHSIRVSVGAQPWGVHGTVKDKLDQAFERHAWRLLFIAFPDCIVSLSYDRRVEGDLEIHTAHPDQDRVADGARACLAKAFALAAQGVDP